MSAVADLYERDFVAWTEEQAARLRAAAVARINLPVDWEHVAEEIEDLGRSTARELRSRMATIIEHLLKLRHSTAADPRVGWTVTIARERAEVAELLAENPSLRGRLAETTEGARRIGVLAASAALRGYGEASDVTADDLDDRHILGDWLP